ncbi:kinetochore protein NDC80 homolog [Nilaparvata lugens]|uniref:kinetochore protein NDC80 homolog n=1 Tax=Nilaparvata lugens TaxID=108931 RepID=UPI00193D16AE|nr:kinetochore protein NDC80 homolog [Nilaparvata lugens]XP_039286232.1 kinetochore protein NDC80 homolog [Nilaparvata lugens]
MRRSSAGRKSSLGRRSTNLAKATSMSSGLDSTAKKEKKSMLLKPGFTMRRSTSEDRLSGIPLAKQGTLSVQRPKSQINLNCMTPKTPKNVGNNPLMAGSRSSRAYRTSSMESNRLSSIGTGMRSTRKERRPINTKEFQTDALKRIQDYFLKQANCREILDNSMTIRPMSTKKFINMTEHLLQKINSELPPLTNNNYVDEIIKNMKIFNYGGKLEKSWLITVNAQHSWQYVVGLIVWLVDAVTLAESVAGDLNILYPDSLGEENSIDEGEEGVDKEEEEVDNVLHDNWKLIVPQLATAYISYIEGDPEFEARQDARADQIFHRIMEKMNLSDESNAALEAEVVSLKSILNEYIAKDSELKNKVAHLETLTADSEMLIDYIDKTKNYILSRKQEIESMQMEIEVLKKKRNDCKMQVACLKEECETLKHAQHESDKKQKQRMDLEESIVFHEKGIEELKKSIYSLDIQLLKTKRKIEEPLVPFNQMIAENVKDEPRLKLCSIGNIILDESRTSNLTDDIKNKLIRIRDEWQQQVHELKSQLQEIESTKSMREEHRDRLSERVENNQKQLEALHQQIKTITEHKEKESARYKAEIAQLSQSIQQTLENMPVIDEDEKAQKIEMDIKQKEDIKALIKAAKYAFQKTREIYMNFANEAEKTVQEALQEVDDYIKEVSE